jgi:putative glutamine amidotransferase
MLPVIGIPECLDAEGRIRAGREYLYGDHAYARAIDRAGGLALHLPIQSQRHALIERIDALLLPGGDDFLPDRPYPDDVRFDAADPRQIDFDSELLRHALAREIPILGLCYGAQLIALAHGGGLHYHLPHDVTDADDHQLPEQTGRHPIQVDSGSRLDGILGREVCQVNSLHHQAIRDAGEGLRVCARAEDGVIEAIEHVDRDFCLGVQWHPEKLDDPSSDAIFGAFVAAARRQAER